MVSTEIILTAQFYDLDPMGVVWHGHYSRFFEEARCQLLDKIGYNYAEMQASGYIWPIVDMRIKYVRPIRFHQTFIVTATIVEFVNRLKIEYLIRDPGSDEILTKAFTVQIAIATATGELCLESPAALTDRLKGMS